MNSFKEGDTYEMRIRVSVRDNCIEVQHVPYGYSNISDGACTIFKPSVIDRMGYVEDYLKDIVTDLIYDSTTKIPSGLE